MDMMSLLIISFTHCLAEIVNVMTWSLCSWHHFKLVSFECWFHFSTIYSLYCLFCVHWLCFWGGQTLRQVNLRQVHHQFYFYLLLTSCEWWVFTDDRTAHTDQSRTRSHFSNFPLCYIETGGICSVVWGFTCLRVHLSGGSLVRGFTCLSVSEGPLVWEFTCQWVYLSKGSLVWGSPVWEFTCRRVYLSEGSLVGGFTLLLVWGSLVWGFIRLRFTCLRVHLSESLLVWEFTCLRFTCLRVHLSESSLVWGSAVREFTCLRVYLSESSFVWGSPGWGFGHLENTINASKTSNTSG